MFVSDSLNFRIREDLMPSCDDYECIFIEIQRDHACNVIVGNVYRAPGTSLVSFLSSLDACLNVVAQEKKTVLCNGRFQPQSTQLC